MNYLYKNRNLNLFKTWLLFGGFLGFVIAVGSYVKPLTEAALKTAAEIGVVSVDMGGTACTVPPAAAQIEKVRQRGAIGKKRKSAKC